MESLQLSFSSVAPIFLLMLLGYVLKRINIADKKTFDSINKLVFKVFLPTLLFYNIYKTETGQAFDINFIAFTIVAILCVFFVSLLVVLLIAKDNKKRGVMLQGFFRSNFAILGIPLVVYMTGEGSLTSLMVAVVVPLFNVLAVVSFEIFRGGNINIGKVLKGIITNPLIIGCLFGLIFFATGIKLPSVVEKAVLDISKVASPLAIIVLGASFTFSSMKGYVKDISIVVLARLVIVPLIVLSVAAMFGFKGEEFACLLITFGSPVSVSSFAMAQQMGGDEKLAGHVVVVSSALCLVSLFVLIFISSYIGLV